LDKKSWRLIIPPGPKGAYRLAQLDDYLDLPRNKFLWEAPFHFCISARVSKKGIHGTWGYGFWNDPFTIGSGINGTVRRFPTLPNTAWFFYASEHNSLSLRNNLTPNGFLTGLFASKYIPKWLFIPGSLVLPLLVLPTTAKIIRKLLRRFTEEDNHLLKIDPTEWHKYEIKYQEKSLDYFVDDQLVYSSKHLPVGKLGCVIWIDNQFAAFPADGKISLGTLKTEETVWLEVTDISITKPSEAKN